MKTEQLIPVLLVFIGAPLLSVGLPPPGYERVAEAAGDANGDVSRVYRSDPATYLVLDEGATIECLDEADTIVVQLMSGLMVIQSRRTALSTEGVRYALGGQRYHITNGTAVLMADEEGPPMAVVLSGDQFALGKNGLLLDQTSAPSVLFEAGGVVMVHRNLKELIREDQLRVHRAVIRSIELLADLLASGSTGVRSADLGAALETAWLLRLRIPNEDRRAFHAILIAAADREEFERRHQPFQLPVLLEIPDEIKPWDKALGW